jgi:hypothetical protein
LVECNANSQSEKTMTSPIILRKDRIATLSREIDQKWEQYWWENMMRLINEMDIDEINHDYLSVSPYITKERVESKMGVIDWDFDKLYEKGIIDDKFIKEHGIVVAVRYDNTFNDLTFENMSEMLYDFDTWHPSDVTGVMPLDEIDVHMYDYEWSKRVLGQRTDIALDFVVKWFDLLGIEFCSMNINVTLQDIKKHEAYWLNHIDWYQFITYNKSITKEIVCEYFEQICRETHRIKTSNVHFLKHLTFEMYLRYIGYTDSVKDKESLDKMLLTDNEYETLNKMLDKSGFDLFQQMGDLNLSIMEKYPYIQWNPNYLANNITNTFEQFKKHEDLINTTNIMCCSHNMTFDYLVKHKDKFMGFQHIFTYPKFLLEKEYPYEKKCFEERKYRQHMAAYRIQQWWLRITGDPKNPVCIRRLEREYEASFQVTPN